MKKDLLHTPEGVRDIYGKECLEKRKIIGALENVCSNFGFKNIDTPTFEFFDVFNQERGTIPSNEMFKFFDHHGNTLVLRPDVTPAIARCAAKYFGNTETPVKLFYTEDVFINYENAYRGQLKETTTIGAELIGNGTEDEDFEIICLAIDCLKKSGLENFQVEVGNVSFYDGLIGEVCTTKDEKEELTNLIIDKNFLAVEEFLDELNCEEAVKHALLTLPGLFGLEADVLEKARELTNNETSLAAIDHLSKLYNKLCQYGYGKYISFDIGSLSEHMYYTGVIFKAYTFGTGNAVLSGGRYDNLIGQFGKERASIGFSLAVDRLIGAIKRQNIPISLNKNGSLIVYDAKSSDMALIEAITLRNNGIRAGLYPLNLDKDAYRKLAADDNYEKITFIENNERKEELV